MKSVIRKGNKLLFLFKKNKLNPYPFHIGVPSIVLRISRKFSQGLRAGGSIAFFKVSSKCYKK